MKALLIKLIIFMLPTLSCLRLSRILTERWSTEQNDTEHVKKIGTWLNEGDRTRVNRVEWVWTFSAPFTFNSPDEWPKWKRCFEQYWVASGLDKEDDECQVSTLLYCLGEEANDVLTSTNITAESQKKFDDVIEKFDDFFKVRKNGIFERARFNQRSQGETETAEQFITSLYSLAADCEFGVLKEQLIRDRIVVGIRDSSLSAAADGLRTYPWKG